MSYTKRSLIWLIVGLLVFLPVFLASCGFEEDDLAETEGVEEALAGDDDQSDGESEMPELQFINPADEADMEQVREEIRSDLGVDILEEAEKAYLEGSEESSWGDEGIELLDESVFEEKEDEIVFFHSGYGLSIDLPTSWKLAKTRKPMVKESVEVANEIWQFKGAAGDQIIALFWELGNAADAEEFAASFVPSLFSTEWMDEGEADGRKFFLLIESETESMPRAGIIIIDHQNVILFDYQPSYSPSGFPDLETLIYGLTFEQETERTGMYIIPPIPMEKRYASSKDGSCCGYSDPGNPYPCCNGNCTWWAHYKRTHDLPDWSWGHAYLWAGRARAEGYHVSGIPSVNSIGCFPNMGNYGHVVHVESVAGDLGSYSTSEMRYGGFDCQIFNRSYSTGSQGESFIYPPALTQTYRMRWAYQEPAGTMVMHGNDRPRVVLAYRNDGTATWYKNDMTLIPCRSDGVPVSSTSVYDSSWISQSVVTKMDQNVISPGNTARFTFYLKLPLRPRNLTGYYFRVKHRTAGLLENWDGAHFPIVIYPTTKYQSHVQNYGWMSWKRNGQTSGTTGRALRLEAIRIKIPYAYVSYRTHVQDYGWMSWKSNGQTSGTTGRSLRVEAIQIKVSGYNIYYKCHLENIGWTGWKRNGQTCGTTGQSRRLEAIKIIVNP